MMLSDENAYESLRQLQYLTVEGSRIQEKSGRIWTKNERNWWWSDRGEEVMGSLFFDLGIRVYWVPKEAELRALARGGE